MGAPGGRNFDVLYELRRDRRHRHDGTRRHCVELSKKQRRVLFEENGNWSLVASPAPVPRVAWFERCEVEDSVPVDLAFQAFSEDVGHRVQERRMTKALQQCRVAWPQLLSEPLDGEAVPGMALHCANVDGSSQDPTWELSQLLECFRCHWDVRPEFHQGLCFFPILKEVRGVFEPPRWLLLVDLFYVRLCRSSLARRGAELG